MQGSITDIHQDIYVISDDTNSIIEVQVPENRSGKLGVSQECLIGDEVAVVGRAVHVVPGHNEIDHPGFPSAESVVRIKATKFVRLPFDPNRKDQWKLALAELRDVVYPMIAKEQGAAIEMHMLLTSR